MVMPRFVNNLRLRWPYALTGESQEIHEFYDGNDGLPADFYAALEPGSGEPDDLMLTFIDEGSIDPATGEASVFEIMRMTYISSSGLELQRAQEGTVQRAWPVNTLVEGRLTAGALNELRSIVPGNTPDEMEHQAVSLKGRVRGYRAIALGGEALAERATAIGGECLAKGAIALRSRARRPDTLVCNALSVPSDDFSYAVGNEDFAGRVAQESLLFSKPLDIATPRPWVQAEWLRANTVRAGGAGYQVRASWLEPAETAQDGFTSTPDWGALMSGGTHAHYQNGLDPDGNPIYLGFSPQPSGAGTVLQLKLPDGVMFFATEVGFACTEGSSDVAALGHISLGSAAQPTLLLNNVALPGTPGDRHLHRIALTSLVGVTQAFHLKLETVASGGHYTGRFYLKGMALGY